MHYNPDDIEKIKQDVRQDFPQRLRNLREASGLSQEAFAKALGVSRAAIGYYENGDRLPDISFLATIYERTGCNLKYLIGYADTMASYEYFNFALNYDLNDSDMGNLRSLLECGVFKILLSNDKFVDFFKDLELLAWDLPHDEQTRAVVEYLCISSLGRLVGEAFLKYIPYLNSEDILQMHSEYQDKLVDDVKYLLANREKFERTPKIEQLAKEVQEEAKNDPFYKLKNAFQLLRKGEQNAET